MERINLTKSEKAVFRWLQTHSGYKATMPRASFDRALRGLMDKDLAYGYYSEEAGLLEAGLTDGGEGYITDNPSLLNPVDWKWIITTAVAAIAAVAACAALLVSCILVNSQ